jgi:hypothetical protein
VFLGSALGSAATGSAAIDMNWGERAVIVVMVVLLMVAGTVPSILL